MSLSVTFGISSPAASALARILLACLYTGASIMKSSRVYAPLPSWSWCSKENLILAAFKMSVEGLRCEEQSLEKRN